MVKKRVMLPVEELDWSSVKYEYEMIQAPNITGTTLKVFVNILESPLIGRLIISSLRKKNKMTELFRNTVIPEPPMYKPEYPPQEPEQNVIVIDEDDKPEQRVETALNCLPEYDPSKWWNGDNLEASFRYWKIRDFAYAYRTRLATPSRVAENLISALEELHRSNSSAPLLISFDPEDIRKQAAASTNRFEQGKPISVLDGTFMAIKDDIDLHPYPTNGGTTWFHEVRLVKKDAVCVSRLRRCGVILIGKGNMHECGLGTTGNNANYGTARNPHALDRYTGGSSSGPAALVASGLCSAALGTDGGGSVRIPSALCGVVGLKTTYGRTDMTGALCDGTVEIIGPLASTVEDAMLVYAAILGSSPADKTSMKPGPPSFPDLASRDGFGTLGALRLGKYTQWFNDVHSDEISVKCEEALKLLSESYGCQVTEIVIPEMHEMRTAHVVSIGSESLMSLTPYCEEGKGSKLTYDTRTNLAIFRTFTAADYVAAQRYRRRLMYYHMEIFKKVDVIVTPTTGMTAPVIPPSALQYGESNLEVSGYLMRFVLSANLLGFPAITVPVGYDKQGLPIGLQLIGRPWAEASLLRLASAVEGLCGQPKKRPAMYYDIMKGI